MLSFHKSELSFMVHQSEPSRGEGYRNPIPSLRIAETHRPSRSKPEGYRVEHRNALLGPIVFNYFAIHQEYAIGIGSLRLFM
jgi:hypothetical protein